MAMLSPCKSLRSHLVVAFSVVTLAGCTAYAAAAPPSTHQASHVQAQDSSVSWQAVEQAMGKAGNRPGR
jgi:hypothetical protein